jgi:hypothetical protein
MFGKDFTDPMTLLTALGITVIVSVVEEVFQMEDILRDFSNHHLWFSNGASPTSCNDCRNISRPDGNFIKC